jgi:hypothetical protein
MILPTQGALQDQETNSTFLWQHKAVLAFNKCCRTNDITGFYLGENISPNGGIAVY